MTLTLVALAASACACTCTPCSSGASRRPGFLSRGSTCSALAAIGAIGGIGGCRSFANTAGSGHNLCGRFAWRGGRIVRGWRSNIRAPLRGRLRCDLVGGCGCVGLIPRRGGTCSRFIGRCCLPCGTGTPGRFRLARLLIAVRAGCMRLRRLMGGAQLVQVCFQGVQMSYASLQAGSGSGNLFLSLA